MKASGTAPIVEKLAMGLICKSHGLQDGQSHLYEAQMLLLQYQQLQSHPWQECSYHVVLAKTPPEEGTRPMNMT